MATARWVEMDAAIRVSSRHRPTRSTTSRSWALSYAARKRKNSISSSNNSSSRLLTTSTRTNIATSKCNNSNSSSSNEIIRCSEVKLWWQVKILSASHLMTVVVSSLLSEVVLLLSSLRIPRWLTRRHISSIKCLKVQTTEISLNSSVSTASAPAKIRGSDHMMLWQRLHWLSSINSRRTPTLSLPLRVHTRSKSAKSCKSSCSATAIKSRSQSSSMRLTAIRIIAQELRSSPY